MVEQDNASFQRLGKRELGPYAFEKCMPSSIADLLANESDENKISGVIAKLAQLLESDHAVESAFLCHSSVVQVAKLGNEGNTFCGYRNIQMLLSSLPVADEALKRENLTVPGLQELIEKAWDTGFNSHGRMHTGGIKGTRKYVGSPEAEAILLYLGIQSTGQAFEGSQAHVDLLDSLERYFASSQIPSATSPIARHDRIQLTSLPPIFFQRPKHSITVVGLEKLKNGKRRLLAFDPAWQAPHVMRQPGPLPSSFVESRWSRAATLWRYRKRNRYLRRFTAFETVTIDLDINN